MRSFRLRRPQGVSKRVVALNYVVASLLSLAAPAGAAEPGGSTGGNTLLPLAASPAGKLSWSLLAAPHLQLPQPKLQLPGGGLMPSRVMPNMLTPAGMMLTPTVRNISGPPAAGGSPGQQCRRAIATAERVAGIPDHLLAAIARIESGRRDPQTGEVDPWPWSINVEGADHIYNTEAEVIAAVRSFQSEGKRSIDVGCLQVNLMYHPDAFATLEQAFDPQSNANYAAKFLTELYRQSGTWPHATANYHSATPELGEPYEKKVMAALPEEQRIPTPAGGPMNYAMNAMSRLSVSPAGPGRLASAMGQMIPMPGLAARMLTGRTLDNYRNNPVTLARR